MEPVGDSHSQDAAAAARREAYDFVRGDSEALGAEELDLALRRHGVELPHAERAAMIAELSGTDTLSCAQFWTSEVMPRIDTGTDRTVALLGGGKPERTEAFGLLDELVSRYRTGADRPSGWKLLRSHAVDVHLALRCAEPLYSLLCRDIAEVDREEYVRVSLLCAALAHIDKVVAAQIVRSWKAVWAAPNTALSAILAKTGAEITAEDVLLAACQVSLPHLVLIIPTSCSYSSPHPHSPHLTLVILTSSHHSWPSSRRRTNTA
jgi:hypothetical protein